MMTPDLFSDSEEEERLKPADIDVQPERSESIGTTMEPDPEKLHYKILFSGQDESQSNSPGPNEIPPTALQLVVPDTPSPSSRSVRFDLGYQPIIPDSLEEDQFSTAPSSPVDEIADVIEEVLNKQEAEENCLSQEWEITNEDTKMTW
ncbi:unnamed protein product, partial [Owenia fusiformis]